MNNVCLIGRPTTDPEIRYSSGKESLAIANVTIAVENPFATGDVTADFIRIKAFGKTAEFIERNIHKGKRYGFNGRIQTGSYEHADGYTVYTTDIVVSNVYFADSPYDEQKTSNTSKNKGGNSNKGNANRRQTR